jgi:hypothetical protein
MKHFSFSRAQLNKFHSFGQSNNHIWRTQISPNHYDPASLLTRPALLLLPTLLLLLLA